MTVSQHLRTLADDGYAAFQRKLLPNVSPERIVGVRTPLLRGLAKEMLKSGEAETFIAILPHPTFDENQLHAFILSAMKDFGRCLGEVERFLPYVDNWATCDQLSPSCFRRHKAKLLPAIAAWMSAGHEYTIRFGIGMLMQHFLDGQDFNPRFLDDVARIRRDEYYIRMMQAWYFATALAKQYDATLPYIEQQRLDRWTHNRTIQKAVESFRITPEQKAHLRSLKMK
ncbi:MAG: DNA alkylation repair protein [Bacteroidaceae bacterium]|nr:DNA alkylation repair protein [Bacteroidaceae bacterium]